MLHRDLRSPVRRAVDDHDFAGDPSGREALVAPVDEVADRDLFVQRGDDD
jgi:hypothetical protein